MVGGMVVVGGVRYRREDAERLGLLVKQAERPANKAAQTPRNKSVEAGSK